MEQPYICFFHICNTVLLFCYVALRTLIIYIDKIIFIDPNLTDDFYHMWVNCFDRFSLCSESTTIKRVPSTSSVSSASGSSVTAAVLPERTNRDFDDTVCIESCGLSPLALQNIREQMALSLERTRILEDQVKSIPQLKVSILLIHSYWHTFFFLQRSI